MANTIEIIGLNSLSTYNEKYISDDYSLLNERKIIQSIKFPIITKSYWKNNFEKFVVIDGKIFMLNHFNYNEHT